MTKQEMQTELQRAFTERSELTKKSECLRFRLRSYGSAYAELADDPYSENLRERVKNAPNLADDWEDLKNTLERIEQLNKVLDLAKF